MPQVLITNPSRRPSKRRRVHHRAKRRNPLFAAKRHHHKRRNPSVFKMRSRRRRNPSSIGSGAENLIKNALIQGGGAFGLDVIWGQLRPMLPASMNSGLTYAAIKAAVTIAAGHFAKRSPIAQKALTGSLVVQTYALIAQTVGTGLTLGGRGGVAGRGGLGGYVATVGQNPKLAPGVASRIPNARITAMPRSGVAGHTLVTQVTPNRAQIYR